MKWIKTTCSAIDRIIEYSGRVIAFGSLLLLGIILCEVFMRRILNQPQIWTMDMICMTFGCYVILISAFGFLRKTFVAVDVLYARLPGIAQHSLHLITYLIFFVPFAFYLIPLSWTFFQNAYVSHELSYSVWQPVTWPIKLALFVGLTMLALQGISEILKHLDWIVEYVRKGGKYGCCL